MTVFSGIVVYLILWFLVLFMVLPWGVRVPDDPEKGHASSAPSNPRMGMKVAITTVIAAVLWGIAYYVIDSGLISLRDA